MDRNWPKWLLPLGAFATCLPVAWLVTRTFQGTFSFSWITTAVVVVSIFFAYRYISQLATEKDVTFRRSRQLDLWAKRAIILGICLIPSPFLWLYFTFGHVANTQSGALLLFGPSFLLLLLTAGLVLFGALVLFWSRKE